MTQTWWFDLEGTLTDSMAATSLRPFTIELLESLRAAGHRIVMWSAGGDDYARRVCERIDIAQYFEAFHTKERGPDGRWVLPALDGDVGETVCVDDQIDGVPRGVRTIRVFPYLGHNPHDRSLEAVIAEARRAE